MWCCGEGMAGPKGTMMEEMPRNHMSAEATSNMDEPRLVRNAMHGKR